MPHPTRTDALTPRAIPANDIRGSGAAHNRLPPLESQQHLPQNLPQHQHSTQIPNSFIYNHMHQRYRRHRERQQNQFLQNEENRHFPVTSAANGSAVSTFAPSHDALLPSRGYVMSGGELTLRVSTLSPYAYSIYTNNFNPKAADVGALSRQPTLYNVPNNGHNSGSNKLAYFDLASTRQPIEAMTHIPTPGMRPRKTSSRLRHQQQVQQRQQQQQLLQQRQQIRNVSSKTGPPTTRVTVNDLKSDLVKQYLRQNPEILDELVTSGDLVSETRLQTWCSTKGQGHRISDHLAPGPTDIPQRDGFLLNSHTVENGDQHSVSSMVLSQWKRKIQTSKRKVLHELSKEVNHINGKMRVLIELADVLASAVAADSFSLYSCDPTKMLLTPFSKKPGGELSQGPTEKVTTGTSVAASVAFTKEAIRLKGLQEKSSNDDLALSNDQAHSALVLPILDDNNTCFGVIELHRHAPGSIFVDEEEEIGLVMLQWYDMLVDYVETHSAMMRQRTLSDFLLEVTKSIFQDIVSMDVVIMKIMGFAQRLVVADRASLFLVDHRKHELYARIFDVGHDFDPNAAHVPNEDTELMPSTVTNPPKEMHHQEIRFSMDKGVAGYVASTGKILNIPDAYKDERFNPEVDIRTGYKTKTILCMPIFIRGNVIGVVQMVNKLQGTFTKHDEEAFATFAIYCGLALHHAKLYEKIRRSEQRYKVALDVLSYHSQAVGEEVAALRARPIPDLIPRISEYTFSPWSVMDDDKPLYCLYMFKALFEDIKYDLDDLIRFTLTVRKNYRNVPYHNWTHAFSVAHAMFSVIKTADHKLTPIESISLFVACLCHDLDHRGKTNQFMVQSASPLAAIYSTSTMEHHHFNQTVAILQNEGHNIFKYLGSDDYKQVLSEIKTSILATDLAVFFKNKATLTQILHTDGFSWDVLQHRNVLTAISMTACDLCAMFKPWELQQQLVYVIMEEFWQQGDEERKRGITPVEMMDRTKQDELPNLETGFIGSICVPCYELLAQVMPDTQPMLDGAKANLEKWRSLANEQERKKGTSVDMGRSEINAE